MIASRLRCSRAARAGFAHPAKGGDGGYNRAFTVRREQRMKTAARIVTGSLVIALASVSPMAHAEEAAKSPTTQPTQEEAKAVPAALNFKMKNLAGKETDLSKYQGKVVMMVNVASACGLTKQYKPLEELNKKYKDQGLAILGFPANNFGAQEPGTDAQIAEFCETKFGVGFDMFSKISVKGDDKAPLYKFLTEQDAIGKKGGDITWNFEKFLLNRKGEVVARFAPRTEPDSAEVVQAIEAELAKK